MAYREKTTWLTLICMVVAYGIYFPLMALRETPPTLFDILWTFGTIAGLQAVAVIIGNIVLAVQAPRGADRRPDERDKAIARRGASAGYYVLMVGTIVTGVVMPFTEPAPKIVNTALFAIVLSQAVSLVLILLSYRRGWHG
jgi:cytochrome b561